MVQHIPIQNFCRKVWKTVEFTRTIHKPGLCMPKRLSSPLCFEMFICSSTQSLWNLKCTQIVSHSKWIDSLSDTANSDFAGKKQYNSYTAHGRIRPLFHHYTFCDYVSLSYSKMHCMSFSIIIQIKYCLQTNLKNMSMEYHIFVASFHLALL